LRLTELFPYPANTRGANRTKVLSDRLNYGLAPKPKSINRSHLSQPIKRATFSKSVGPLSAFTGFLALLPFIIAVIVRRVLLFQCYGFIFKKRK